MFGAPMAIIEPHSGVGIGTPAPTKLSAEVSRIEKPIVGERLASAGVSAFGMTCTKAIRSPEPPTQRAASTKGRSRTCSTAPRVTRRKNGTFRKASATMTFWMLGPRNPTSASAKMKSGKA